MLNLVNQKVGLLDLNLKSQYQRLFFKRFLISNLFVFLIQVIGLNLNVYYLFKSPLWFFTGTACAFIFLQGYRVFPGIFLGNLLGFYLAKIGFWLAFGCAAAISLQAVLLFWFCQNHGIPSLIFYRKQDFFKFLLFSLALTGICSILLVFICHLYEPEVGITLQLWLRWWLGNLNAILIFASAIISWDAYFTDFYSQTNLKNKVWICTLYGLLILVTAAIALSSNLNLTLILALTNLLITAAICILFGWCGAITALFISGVMLNLAAILGAPVFYTPFVRLILPFLQLLLCVEAILAVVYTLRVLPFSNASASIVD